MLRPVPSNDYIPLSDFHYPIPLVPYVLLHFHITWRNSYHTICEAHSYDVDAPVQKLRDGAGAG